MKITSIEIANVQIVDSMSEETTCFTADVLVNGARAGRAENSGKGGATLVRIADRDMRIATEARAAEVLAGRKAYDGPLATLIDTMLLAYRRMVHDAEIERHDAEVRAGFARDGMPAYVRVIQGPDHGDDTLRWFGLRAYDSSRPTDPHHALAAIAAMVRREPKGHPVRSWVVRSTATGEVLYASPAAPPTRVCDWVQCHGSAHDSPFVDNCSICEPRWGALPTCPVCGHTLTVDDNDNATCADHGTFAVGETPENPPPAPAVH